MEFGDPGFFEYLASGGPPPTEDSQGLDADEALTLIRQSTIGTGLSDQDILAIRNDFLSRYDPKSSDPKNDVRQAVEGYVGQKTSRDIQDKIDRATNPGKYLTPEQVEQNKSTALRLAQQFGQEDPDLVDFLSQRLAEGESAFEISSFLRTTPDYQKKQAEIENQRVQEESAAARQSLDTELLKSEEETFARATPSIIASYMKAGRLNSSGLQSALTQARADLAKERQGFLANAAYNDSIRSQGYRREDFVGGNAQAFNQYLRQNEPAYQQRFALQGASNQQNFQQPYESLSRMYSLNDRSRERQYELEDYDRQQSDFNRYLEQSRSQSRSSALYGLLGAGVGAGIGGWANIAANRGQNSYYQALADQMR